MSHLGVGVAPHVPNPAAGSPTHRTSVLGTKSKQSLLGRSASPASARKSPAGGAHDGVVTGTNPMLELEEDPAPRETEVEKDAATRFGGRSASALSDVMRHMRQSYEKGHVKKPEKATQVNVPVFQTVMIKRLRDDPGNSDVVIMDCTIIQRSLFFDFDQIERDDHASSDADMFLIRVNDGNASSLQLDIRKVVNLEVASDRPGLVAHCVTASAEIPVERTTIFARSPFNICALEVMLELTSFSATIAGKKYELRPDLVGPIDDLRNLVSCRDFDTTLDAMHDFDIIDTSPSVCYQIDSKFDANGKVKTVYAPKVKITFYCRKDALQPFLSIFMPIMFCALGNFLNNTMSAEMFCHKKHCRDEKLVKEDAEIEDIDYDSPNLLWFNIVPQHLANSLTLGLTLIFLLPTISKSESTSNGFEINQLIVFFLFAGLIMGTIPAMEPFRLFEYTNMRLVCMWSSNCLMFGSLLIPMTNWLLYRGIINALAPECTEGKPSNFNGRPGKSKVSGKLQNVSGSTIDISMLTPVYACGDGEGLRGKALTINPDMNRKHEDAGPWREMFVDDTLKWVVTGTRSEDLGDFVNFYDMLRLACKMKKSSSDFIRSESSAIRKRRSEAGKKKRSSYSAKTTMSDRNASI